MKTKVPLLTIVLFISTAFSQAATEPAKIKEVALFKNGLGYFVSEITPPDKQASFTITPPAAPTHGSFWLSYPDKVELKSFIASEKEIEEQLAAVSIPELLKANIGKKVRLIFDNDKEIECTIKYFPQERPRPIPDPYAPGHDSGAARDYYGGYQPYPQPSMMVVESQTGQMCLNPGTIKRVEFTDGSVEKTFSSKTKRYQLEVTLAAPADGKKLLLSQLAKGITWAPSYIIDITDPDKALISAKAEIINEACDLNDVVVHLVTGYPHLQFADVMSPMALKENLAQFLQALNKGESERGRAEGSLGRVMSQRAAYAYQPESPMPGIMPAYGTAAAGTIAEDLFFYPIEKIHLAKGEVGYFPLFTESVPYKHIYTWDIPDYINEQDRYNQRQQEPVREEEVWHCVRLENTGTTPWTTAPAETIKDGLILGQDTLNYTPAKGKSTLRITQAVNVKAEQVEREIQRQRDALHLYGDNFDLITVEGKLSIANVQPKTVTVEIAKTLSGDVKTMQPEAKTEKLAKGLKSMNGLAKLTWTIELEPNERKELSYTYEVYVRR